MFIGRGFKREIVFDYLKEYARHLRPNRSWLDLFSLTLSCYFDLHKFDITILTDNLSEDEVIIIDSHDDIFKAYQIQCWRKDRISDIFPAIKCPSFKSENRIFKISEIDKIIYFISDQDHTKSIVIENVDKNLSINLVYGDTVKIISRTFFYSHNIEFFNKLQERYKLWEIDDCACKPKKIRVWVNDFENLKNVIDKLKWISNIIDIKLGMNIDCKQFTEIFSNYNIMIINNSARRMSYSYTNLIFTGDTLAVVDEGNYYNFRLDQRTKKSENSVIKGKI